MKSPVSIPTLPSAVMSVVLLLGGCTSSLTYEQAMSRNRRSMSDMTRLNDANFLVEATSYNLLQQRILELAEERGYSAAVVNHATLKSPAYEKMGSNLKKLARKKDIRIPGELKAEHQALFDRLAGEGRSDFDHEFVETLADVIEDNTALFEGQASAANDADIRSFSARNLTVLRDHAKAIEQVDEQLMSRKR